VIRIKNIKFNNSQFFNSENINLDYFLREKVERIIKIINIQFLISLLLIIAVNSEINKSSHFLKDFKFLILLNSALISFINLNSILN